MTAQLTFELNAEVRHDQGKGASRRLRRTQDKIPAILYGGGEDPIALTLDHKKIMHALENEGFYSHILTINISGKKHQAVLKDVQRHHFKKAIFHMDFLRVKATDHVSMHIPLHFLNEAKSPGVKAGGIVFHHLKDVEVRCLAKAIPEYIEIDLSYLSLDQSIHLSQLRLPRGVEITALHHGDPKEHDVAVVSIHLPRRPLEEEETKALEEVDTEVLPKGKEKEGSAKPEATSEETKAAAAGAKAPAAGKEKESKDKADKGKDKGKGK